MHLSYRAEADDPALQLAPVHPGNILAGDETSDARGPYCAQQRGIYEGYGFPRRRLIQHKDRMRTVHFLFDITGKAGNPFDAGSLDISTYECRHGNDPVLRVVISQIRLYRLTIITIFYYTRAVRD